ncbi:MAG: Rieske (2Fe-2S) protein [Rhodobacteraceae bacterium]|nr:Rieske (2Fe-2S) protein [Paracoccaceae bacterium]
MNLEWHEFPDAPAPGALLCTNAEIPRQGIRSIMVDGFPVLLLAGRNGVLAFVNCCPHQFLPLDHRGGDVLSADGERLICSNHGAVFRVSDGKGIAGEGRDLCLSAIPLDVRAGGVFITG